MRALARRAVEASELMPRDLYPPGDRRDGGTRHRHQRAMLTARATITARVAIESTFSAPIASFAHLEYGIASVGEKAMELVSET